MLAALAVVVLMVPATLHAATWEPGKTWVFFACLVTWKDSKTFASFDEKIRKDDDFLDSLRAKGVTEDHIVYLKDSQATIASVQSQFREFLKKPGPNDWIIVYFEGHGYKEDDGTPFLATYDVSDAAGIKGWKFEDVPETIEKNFKGSRAVIALDNCYSGTMAEVVKKSQRRVSYAILASSLASQESTGNWTFTEALTAGFKGSTLADLDHDGKITFWEMGRYSMYDMLFGEEQLATIEFTGDFDAQTVIATAPPTKFPRQGERVEAYSVDGWYKGFLIDSKPGKYKVHYYGYQDADDEWVPVAKIRPPKVISYQVGQKVSVEWHGKWYPATVLKATSGVHLITYVGYDHSWDEWVASNRIKLRK